MTIHQIYHTTDSEIVDYQTITAAISHLKKPRDKLSSWVKSGDLIRIKRGLYAFAQHITRKPINQAHLANLLYGPSLISLQYALAFYGLIPEKVATVTSVTTNRNKWFSTPVGEFSYRYLNSQRFALGSRIIQHHGENLLIASAEKALCDQILLNDFAHARLLNDAVADYVTNDLRVDKERLLQLDTKLLSKLATVYRNKSVAAFVSYIIGEINA